MSEDHAVIRPWVRALPWKQQSILFSGFRGPDNDNLPNTKKVGRWMRAVSQENADPSKSYMADAEAELPDPATLDKELEYAPLHFVHHFADALAVIAYGHTDARIRRTAYTFHYWIADELMHFIPEPPDIFAWRHRDKPGGIDPQPDKPYDDRPWVGGQL